MKGTGLKELSLLFFHAESNDTKTAPKIFQQQALILKITDANYDSLKNNMNRSFQKLTSHSDLLLCLLKLRYEHIFL